MEGGMREGEREIVTDLEERECVCMVGGEIDGGGREMEGEKEEINDLREKRRDGGRGRDGV